MSFVKIGHGRKKKAFVRKRPQWDDTVNDLDSYRATPEEVRMRREAHKSKNHIAVKLEKMRKEKKRQRTGLTNVEARHVAILKEVLHDQKQLDDVLSKSDHMMSMVKDLFGDDAKKFLGFPNVTLPPGGVMGSGNLVPQPPEIHTRIEKLSESVMSSSALNDLSAEESTDSETEDHPQNSVDFPAKLDLQHFQHFLHEEEKRNTNTNAIPSSTALPSYANLKELQQLSHVLREEERRRNGAGSGLSGNNNQTLSTISNHGATSIQFSSHSHGPAHSTQLPGEHPSGMQASHLPGQMTPPRSLQDNEVGQQNPKREALNDTGRVKKTRRRIPAQETSQNTTSSWNLTDMKKVLESLHTEITEFEQQTGRRCTADIQRTETFTGYTVALVTTVTKLIHYLKETEMRLQAEIMVREQLTQDVGQLAVTIDSLTSELIMTQEEFSKLFSEQQCLRQQMQGEMALLQSQMLDLKHQQSSMVSQQSTPGKGASGGSENEEANFNDLPDYLVQPSAAVLLSPLVRKTRVPDVLENEAFKQKRQTSLVDIHSLAESGSYTQDQQPSSGLPKASTVSTLAASNSSSSTVHSDPPRLTQVPPVMATVTVPRPISLVQSNLRAGLPGSQEAGLASQAQAYHLQYATMSSSGIPGTVRLAQQATRPVTQFAKVGSLGGGSAMEQQIAELNRQHAEAQQRLQVLLQQQKQQQEELYSQNEANYGTGEVRETIGATCKPHLVQEGTVPTSVSPPISPISHRSERFTSLNPVQRLVNLSREIKFALPTVDLETSTASQNSPS